MIHFFFKKSHFSSQFLTRTSSLLLRALLVAFTFISLKAQGFFDSIVDSAEKIAEASALSSAAHELFKTVNEGSSNETLEILEQSTQEISQKLREIEAQGQRGVWAKSELESLLKGPRFSHQNLTESLRTSSRYLRRLRSLYLGLTSFPKAASAYAQSETVLTLQEQLKLQRSSLALQAALLSEIKFQNKKQEIESEAFNRLMTEEFVKRRGISP